MSLSFGVDVAPKAALNFFRKKGLKASFSWQDMWQEEHDAAFTVAKMMDVDLLADVKQAVDDAIANGETFAEFAKKLKPELVKRGWWGQAEMEDPLTGKTRMVQLGSARRLQTIFRTNMQMAYSAGDWEQITETAEDAPYLMYDAIDDNRTRPQHRAWDGTVLRWDNPWWQTHRPPNGWYCRCSTIQLSKYDLQAMGKSVSEAPPVTTREYVNKRSGEISRVPDGIDPGFAYNPGASRQQHLNEQLAAKRKAFDER
ncbi:MAG TPA: phage minor head protein [Steroidobacteraceae bacterium]|nr:phage minor head protein [Steroidobacteraceae bacterium]